MKSTAPGEIAPTRPADRGSWVDWLLGRLSRVTTSGRFIPEIDGLRFIAILLVFLIHVHYYTGLRSPAPVTDGGPLQRVAAVGGAGVPLFFAISGFILALPFAEHFLRSGPPVSLGRFYLRRVTRLEPPYLLSLVLMLPFVLLSSRETSDLWPRFFATCAYLHGLIYGDKSPINFVTWSLEIEVQFYLIAPFLCRVFALRRLWRRGLIVGAMFGLGAAQEWLLGLGGTRMGLSLPHYGQYFLAGLLLADLFVADWGGRPRHDARWDLVTLAGWPAIYGAIAVGGPVRDCATSFLIVLVYVALFRGVYARRVLTNRWVTTIGGMCYSIYLLHVPILTAFGHLTIPLTARLRGDVHLLANAVVLAIPMLAISAVYFALVERPCMQRRWVQNLWARLVPRRRPVPVASRGAPVGDA